MNNRQLKLWAAAIVGTNFCMSSFHQLSIQDAADATKHDPINTLYFDGLRDGRIDVIQSRGNRDPQSLCESSPDPTTALLAVVTFLMTSQLSLKATLDPSTQTIYCHRAPTPFSTVPTTVTKVRSCLFTFQSLMLNSPEVHSSLEFTIYAIADVPFMRLCNLLDVVEGH